MASTVYFMNDRAGRTEESIQYKGVKLLRDAGIEGFVHKGDRVGIKIHVGEWGNSLNLRPHWVSTVVQEVKRCGGIPTVVEGSVIPGGPFASRSHASDHLATARHHGFTEETLGCPIVILDGDMGLDDEAVPVHHGVFLKSTRMAARVRDFDKFIVVSHFKGHQMGVFGGAVKNIGIGMASARGKLAVHNLTNKEIGFKTWELNQQAIAMYNKMPYPNLVDVMTMSCPQGCFTKNGDTVARDKDKCSQCGFCFAWLALGMYHFPPELYPSWPPAIADSAAGIIDAVGKDNWMFLNYAMDITPGCDCNNYHDKTMIPNLGVFASKDPVAVDMACIEACEASVAVPGSVADEYGFGAPNTERFTNCTTRSKTSQWAQINSAVYNGIGSSEYELVTSEPCPPNTFLPEMWTKTDNLFLRYKEFYSTVDMDSGDYGYDMADVKLTQEQLAVKPSGKVGEKSIKDM
jgi:uncharacterized Fe-S center protein